jgi:hypothetical protein
MRMIEATPNGSHRVNQGKAGVRVGIIDTGIDGTLVAGLAAGAINGLGIAGVAPKVTLVSTRAGQDSGFFFLQPTIDALTYAGSAGIDVVNLTHPAGPRLHARQRGPAGRRLPAGHRQAPHGRQLLHHRPDRVQRRGLGVCARSQRPQGVLLQLGRRADRRLAPGGDSREGFGTTRFNIPENRVLSALPKNVADAKGLLNPDGTPKTPLVLRDCEGTCAYYQYLQGTSMASPHAVGVAALVVSKSGHKDRHHAGLTLDPRTTERILRGTATQTPCPVPPLFDYPETNSVDALCEGTIEHNGFDGDGIVNALAASIR